MPKGRPDEPVIRVAGTPGRPAHAYAGGPDVDHEPAADDYSAHLDELEAELPEFERELERIEKKREKGES